MPPPRSPPHPPAPASLGPVLDFMRLLWAVDHVLTSRSKCMHATLGVTGPQRLVVRIVGQRPGIAAGELATILHVHPSTLTGVLRRLVARRVLSRAAAPDDSRRASLRLTKRGIALDAVMAGTVEAGVRTAIAGLPPRDVAAAARVLQRLARVLGESTTAARRTSRSP